MSAPSEANLRAEGRLRASQPDSVAVQPTDDAKDYFTGAGDTASTTTFERADEDPSFAPINNNTSAMSRLRSRASEKTEHVESSAEDDEIERLMSRMFGKTRQANTQQETRHAGVVFKNLTVKGQGLGSAIHGTIADIFVGPFRSLAGLFKGRSRTAVRTIIDDFTGCIKPGEMVLVLGRPGSGCSTILKVLANQRAGYEEVSGEVTYGGASAKTMAKDYRSELLYNPEDDIHYATLSVKNTLSFALKTKTPGKESRPEGESKTQYIQNFLQVVTKLFWIEHTLGTKVGDEHVRGVSGGEKKRVSIAEAMIGRASVQCWDNSTRGLDASTALEYVQSLRALTNMTNNSTCIALYQAGEQLWDAFDKVLLIDEGKCLYFGPTNDAVKYFESIGFERPPRWTSADFLTSVTDPHERKIREGWEDRVPRSSEQFAEAFRRSNVAQSNLKDIRTFETSVEEQHQEQADHPSHSNRKNYELSFWEQVWVCTWRQALVIVGDQQSLYGKWGGIVFQALIVGSLFYNQPSNAAGVFTRGGTLFFVLLFNALLSLAELSGSFASRPILQKHKTFSFYRPSAFALAQTVMDVPQVFVQVTLFNLIVYFMANLARTASQFWINWLFTFLITMTMYAFFRSLGAWFSSLDKASIITGVAIQAFITYTGYLIPTTSMHPWLSWIRWIDPITYAFEALMVNEFHGAQLECVPPYLVPQGPGAEPQYQSCTVQGSTPGSSIVLGDNYLAVALEYSYSHLWRNFGILIAFLVALTISTMVGSEFQKPNKGGASVTVFKRGEAPESVQSAMKHGNVSDEENIIRTEKNVSSPSSSDDLKTADKATGQKVAANTTVFTWLNVNYRIPTKQGERLLLNDVQGYVRPGKLTALMGSSGAGKTTLLNTLAQRINFGVVTGDFLVDGRPLPKSFQRATGYAEQMDVHEPTATVREALRFSALLRQPREVSVQEKYEYCETIIDLLEMREIAGATIGRVGGGLNQEQRKRLTIGVELASKPELLLFLDEPTSGLDSGAAFNIVRFLRKLADAGQAILCTIHQPSSVLMAQFDELLLLKTGGRVVYHGPVGRDCRSLIDYFESKGASKCPPGTNPAEYMLEAIGAGDPTYKGQDWGDVWASSDEHATRTREIQEMVSQRQQASSSEKSAATTDDREFAMPLGTQIWAVLKRDFTSYWRNPEYMIGKFALNIFAGLFNCFTFYKPGNSPVDMQNRVFSIFMVLVVAPPLIQQLQPRFLEFRQIFSSRERNSKIYSWLAFTVGAVAVEIPYSALAGTIYFMCWWWGSVGWHTDSFTGAYTWLTVLLFELYHVSLGQAIAAFSANELLASLFVPVFFTFITSFCGVVAPPASLPYFWRSWMYPLSPFRYLIEGMLGVAVHGQAVECGDTDYAYFNAPPGFDCANYTAPYISQAGGYVTEMANGQCAYCQYASGDEFAARLNVFYDNKWRDYGIFWAYVVFGWICTFAFSYLFLVGGRKLKGLGKKR